MAVSPLRVLAGGNFFCGFLAAKISPVVKFATKYALTFTFGGAGISAVAFTIMPVLFNKELSGSCAVATGTSASAGIRSSVIKYFLDFTREPYLAKPRNQQTTSANSDSKEFNNLDW